MYEECPRPSIIEIETIDLSGEAKQTAKSPHTSADHFFSFSLFPNYSKSLPIQEMLYELHGTLGCHTCGCSWALLGCFWASPGLLGLSESSLAAASCSWASPGASLLEPRATIKMTPVMTNLADQIQATVNFLGLRVALAS